MTTRGTFCCNRTWTCRGCSDAMTGQARIQDLGQGASGVMTLRGGPEPNNLLKIGDFPLKLPENCMILKKSWGQGGAAPRAPLDPLLLVSLRRISFWSRMLQIRGTQ